ncbi:MAG: hypothetical protein COY58_07510 [Gammaproteobacteria bacterium CG_4_10_14_0_8_um_filter_38_16]|nr:MAG: hypothetical protein COY58_07510 [Gammaproteobacteria bacterium CG_4_10_14_0_8_um_filter_38_16]PJA02884.1 MAG: hypothetical protein COX72_08100 [Gammaproteobacteria bacterium CG_4_10_14_0_2_um_filter_38_22]PJB10952.1 MAG: hypothetical protein CO120_02125 [Gammaproteobacteria bacterium CG_4_9_14_3_um_filter_38_9]
MRDWNKLADEVRALAKKKYRFPKNRPPFVRSQFIKFKEYDRLQMGRLDATLRAQTLDDEKKLELAALFLRMRFMVIANTSFDYTLNWRLPSNRACLHLAEKIKREDQAVIALLMPTIQTVIGAPGNLKMATEEGDDQFVPSQFLLNAAGDAVIAVDDLLDSARDNTELLFLEIKEEEKYHPDSLEVEHQYTFSAAVTPADLDRICAITGKAGREYLCALEKKHRLSQGEKPSVGHALKKLVHALLKASVLKDGSEDGVSMLVCFNPIHEFYQQWSFLPSNIKDRIAVYRPKNNHEENCSLESQLLALFDGASIVLTPAEYEKIESDDVFPCIHQIANVLGSILNSHSDLFKMPLTGMELTFIDEELPTDKYLDYLSANFKKALRYRVPVLGDDAFLLQSHLFFEIASRDAFQFYYSDFESEEVKKCISLEIKNFVSSLAHLSIVLSISPPKNWLNIIRILDDTIGLMLASDDKSWDGIVYLMQKIPSDDWVQLCDALYEWNETHNIIKVYDLLFLVDAIPHSQYDIFRKAIFRLSFSVIKNSDRAGALFWYAPLEHCGLLYHLFRPAIEAALTNAETISAFFCQVLCENWLFLALISKSILQPHISTDFMKAALSKFNEDQQLYFIGAMLPLLDEAGISQTLFLDLLLQVNIKKWVEFFNIWGAKRISAVIQNLPAFEALLKHLVIEQRHVPFMLELSKVFCFEFKVEPTKLYDLMMQFPLVKPAYFLKLFINQLPYMLSQLMHGFLSALEYGNKLTAVFLKQFGFYLEQALPLLLSDVELEKIAPWIFDETILGGHIPNSPITLLRTGFSEIKIAVECNQLCASVACYQKIRLLSQFINTDESERSGFEKPFAQVRDALLNFFGKDFFADVMEYEKKSMSAAVAVVAPMREVSVQTDFFRSSSRSASPTHTNSVRLYHSASAM